jgi:hypothetical protein
MIQALDLFDLHNNKMIKKLFLLSFLLSSMAFARPTLTSAPYAISPAAVTFTVNGGSPIACTLPAVSGGVQPTCDLASIATPGTYTLILTVTTNVDCVNTLNAATCSGAGSASSAPFAYTWNGSGVPTPVLSVAP